LKHVGCSRLRNKKCGDKHIQPAEISDDHNVGLKLQIHSKNKNPKNLTIAAVVYLFLEDMDVNSINYK
jgi:hypothetical protein